MLIEDIIVIEIFFHSGLSKAVHVPWVRVPEKHSFAKFPCACMFYMYHNKLYEVMPKIESNFTYIVAPCQSCNGNIIPEWGTVISLFFAI